MILYGKQLMKLTMELGFRSIQVFGQFTGNTLEQKDSKWVYHIHGCDLLFTRENPKITTNTIEGGLGWWHDTRFGTEFPKFIMGGVAFDFTQWANGVGAGSSEIRDDGRRDWNVPGGKYGCCPAFTSSALAS